MAWGSLAGCLVALVLSVSQRILSLEEAIDSWVNGMRSMLIAIVILTLAWSLGSVTEEMGTASYLSQVLSDRVSLNLIPVIVFAVAAAAFWGRLATTINGALVKVETAVGGTTP